MGADPGIVIGSGWWITSDYCYFLSKIKYNNYLTEEGVSEL